jgi:hypothetical protein
MQNTFYISIIVLALAAATGLLIRNVVLAAAAQEPVEKPVEETRERRRTDPAPQPIGK